MASRQWVRFGAARLLAIACFVLPIGQNACSRVDGSPVDTTTLGYKVCKGDLDCGSGRYCNDQGYCAVDCTQSKDCALLSANPSEPNTLVCSPCGRCIADGSRDLQCGSSAKVSCASDGACERAVGNGWACGAERICVRTCTDDSACVALGRGMSCGPEQATSSGPKNVCARGCFRPNDCAVHGFAFECSLPPGVDPAANAVAPNPVNGVCAERKDGVDFGPSAATPGPALAYKGVWAFEVNTVARTVGVPLIGSQDTVSNQYSLVKITPDGQNITLTQRWCSIDYFDFNEDDSPRTELIKIRAPDRYVDAIPLLINHAQNVPELAAGARFRTDRMLEVRGAKLDDVERSPLPSFKNLTGQIDQDRDGKPGLTLSITGLFSGQLYHALRWWVVYDVNVVDRDHLQGLIDGENEQSILGATSAALVYDVQTVKHPQPDRAYFRAQRMADTASCTDVTALAKNTKGSWLEFRPHYDAALRP